MKRGAESKNGAPRAPISSSERFGLPGPLMYRNNAYEGTKRPSRWYVLTSILLAILWLAPPAVAGLTVTAHISREDVQKVCAVIRTATREPILSIDPIYVGKPRATAIARNEFTLVPSKNGKLEEKTITVYELTDEVTVRTGSELNPQGGGFAVRRVGGTWKIVSKSFWIH